MTRPIKRKKHVLLRIPPREMFTVAYVLIFLSLMLVNGANCFLSGHTEMAILSAALFIALLWSWTPALVACGLRFHFWKHLHDRQYYKIDMAYWRVSNLLKRIGRPLYIDVITSDLALMRLTQGYYDSAESLFQEALKAAQFTPARRADRRNQEERLALFKGNLANAFVRNHKPIDAEVLCEEALEQFGKLKSAPVKAVYTGCTHNTLACIKLDFGELDKAQEHLKIASDCWEALGKKEPLPKILLDGYRVATWLLTAMVYIKRDDWANAEIFCAKAKAVLGQEDLAFPSLLIKHINNLANEYLAKGLYKDAEDLIEISYQFASELPFHPDSVLTVQSYEKLLTLINRESEIADMRSYLKPIGINQIAQDKIVP
jgi:tetratricopeptide (TPR) repeat protein